MSLPPDLALSLAGRLRRGETIVVCGRTGSGKTSLLRELALLADDERLVVLEDTPELDLPAATRLRTGVGVDLGDLVRYCLRQRPDRIVIGEVRGPEAEAALAAWNSGHSGLATVHAASAEEARRRLIDHALKAGNLSQPAVEELVDRNVDVFLLVNQRQVVEAWAHDEGGRLVRLWASATSPKRAVTPEPPRQDKGEQGQGLGL